MPEKSCDGSYTWMSFFFARSPTSWKTCTAQHAGIALRKCSPASKPSERPARIAVLAVVSGETRALAFRALAESQSASGDVDVKAWGPVRSKTTVPSSVCSEQTACEIGRGPCAVLQPAAPGSDWEAIQIAVLPERSRHETSRLPSRPASNAVRGHRWLGCSMRLRSLEPSMVMIRNVALGGVRRAWAF
jgi:hypothetical protein